MLTQFIVLRVSGHFNMNKVNNNMILWRVPDKKGLGGVFYNVFMVGWRLLDLQQSLIKILLQLRCCVLSNSIEFAVASLDWCG